MTIVTERQSNQEWRSAGVRRSRHRRSGLLVPERDINGISHPLRGLLTNTERRVAVGTEAERFVRHRFDVRRQTFELEGIYDSVL